jgi:uncharacterized protein (TIGR02246 family)
MPGRARVEDLLARYCLAWDETDLDALADCFTSDATLTLDVPRAGRVVTRRGRRSILTAFAASTAASTVQLRHVVSNIAYDPTSDDAATVMAYQPVFVVAAGGTRLSTFSCLHDRVVRQDGGWRFKSRRLVFDTAIPTTTPFFTAPGAEEGNP